MDLNKVLNIGLYIALFYLTISTNFIGELYNKELVNALHTNYYLKHLLGYITLLTFIIISNTKTNNLIDDLKLSIITYIIFMMSTKINPHYFILSITCIFSAFMLEKITDTYVTNIEKKQRLKNIYNYLGVLGIVLIIYGCGKEYIRQHELHEYDFSLIKFFF